MRQSSTQTCSRCRCLQRWCGSASGRGGCQLSRLGEALQEADCTAADVCMFLACVGINKGACPSSARGACSMHHHRQWLHGSSGRSADCRILKEGVFGRMLNARQWACTRWRSGMVLPKWPVGARVKWSCITESGLRGHTCRKCKEWQCNRQIAAVTTPGHAPNGPLHNPMAPLQSFAHVAKSGSSAVRVAVPSSTTESY
jgi:hypothetical protein